MKNLRSSTPNIHLDLKKVLTEAVENDNVTQLESTLKVCEKSSIYIQEGLSLHNLTSLYTFLVTCTSIIARFIY